jgi:hypothetical protein
MNNFEKIQKSGAHNYAKSQNFFKFCSLMPFKVVFALKQPYKFILAIKFHKSHFSNLISTQSFNLPAKNSIKIILKASN